jgi:hypothetical protein
MTTISTPRPITSDEVDRVLQHALAEADRADWSLLRSARRIAFKAQQDPARLELARGNLANGHTVAYAAQARRALATITVAIAMASEIDDHVHGGGHAASVPAQPH